MIWIVYGLFGFWVCLDAGDALTLEWDNGLDTRHSVRLTAQPQLPRETGSRMEP